MLSPFLIGAALVIGLRTTTSISGTYHGPSGNKTTPQLIAGVTANAGQPWDWNELERRLQSGQLSQQESEQAIDGLITWLQQNHSQGHHGPLSWADGFVGQVSMRNLIDPQQFERLAKAFYGPEPVVALRRTVRAGQPLELAVEYGDHWNLPGVEFVKAVREVRVDGEPVSIHSGHNQPGSDPDLLSADAVWDIPVKAGFGAGPGTHEVTVVVDAAVLARGTKPTMVESKPGQAKHWPKGLARWTSEVTLPLTVVGEDELAVGLVTAPALDPLAAGVLKVKSLRATRDAKGVRVAVDWDLNSPPAPVSFKVTLRLAGEEHELGSISRSANRTRSRGNSGVVLASLPANVVSADFVLRPDPYHAEGDPTIDEIWGEEVVLKGVPLERYDLQADATRMGD